MADAVRIAMPAGFPALRNLRAAAVRLVELGARTVSVASKRAAGEEYLTAIVLHRGGRYDISTSDGVGSLDAHAFWLCGQFASLHPELKRATDFQARLDAISAEPKIRLPGSARRTDKT